MASRIAFVIVLGGLVTCASERTPELETRAVATTSTVGDERELRAPLLEGIGDHHHEISTGVPLAQRLFDQGLVLHFGFNHAEAARSFREAARLDPECAICFAALALPLGPNINAPRDPADVPEIHRALEQARARMDQATPRERAYIEALSKRWASEALEDRAALDEAYAEAMGAVAAAYPDDDDAAALYAEALMILHPWDYWERDGEPKPWTPTIVRTLERLLARAPDHPFGNHLYIHAVEASSEPERAMSSAERLGAVAPGAGHLVHMPSHVYIRTGDYHAASLANERAIEADERYLAQVHAQGLYPLAYYPHNYHFLWATTTLEGRARRSLEAARGTAARADRQAMRQPGMGTLQHFLSIPYFALVAFGRWDQALVEPAPPEPDLLYPMTMWRYMRGMALASTGKIDEARAMLQAIEAAGAGSELEGVTIWDINDTRALVRIAAAILAGRIAETEERYDRAIAAYRQAVEREDGLDYDEPPPWGPATRRYLGRALVRTERFAEAEAVYREDLARFPHNGWALFGLVQALRGQGKGDEAQAAQERFEAAWSEADVRLAWSAF